MKAPQVRDCLLWITLAVQRNILWIALAALVVLAVYGISFHIAFLPMFLPMLLGIATWIIIIIAIWRAMKAHESIAESLRQIALKDQKM